VRVRQKLIQSGVREVCADGTRRSFYMDAARSQEFSDLRII
jgi:hypothetical protein